MSTKVAFDNSSLLGQLGSLLDEINSSSVKTAAAKKADVDNQPGGSGEGGKDPGGYQGASSHPSAKADAGTQAATPGARAAENKADVERDVHNNVETADDNDGDIKDDITQIGTKKTPVGEDPSVEHHYKGTKDDPGTSSPANAEEVGEKYSSLAFPELYKVACELCDGVLARIGNGEVFGKQAGNKSGEPATKTAASATPQQAAQAGYDLASMAAALGQSTEDESFQKFATAQGVVHELMKQGFEEADLVGEFLYKTAAYEEAILKQADGDGDAPPPPPEAGGGGAPPMPPGGGGDPMAGGAPPMPGGPDAGGAPPMPGGPGGGEGGEDPTNELAMALVQSGIDPMKLIEAIQAVAGGAGGAAGGPEPGAGDAGKEAASKLSRDDLESLWKAAHSIKNHLESGRFRWQHQAKSKEAQAARDDAKNYFGYVKEVLGIR